MNFDLNAEGFNLKIFSLFSIFRAVCDLRNKDSGKNPMTSKSKIETRRFFCRRMYYWFWPRADGGGGYFSLLPLWVRKGWNGPCHPCDCNRRFSRSGDFSSRNYYRRWQHCLCVSVLLLSSLTPPWRHCPNPPACLTAVFFPSPTFYLLLFFYA